jgi:nucleoside-diphosphate-sugar epimerase
MPSQAIPLLITGGTGQIGQSLRRGWPWFMRGGLRPIWQSRVARPGYVEWDILGAECPEMVASGIILGLAGAREGSDLSLNARLARATCRAAAERGARHIFLASSAAVYGPSHTAHSESSPLTPETEYGRAKLAMEQAALDWHSGQTGVGLTLLRIGNVVGFDSLLGGAKAGIPVVLDPVEGQDGGPLRSYIGPNTLGSVLARLAGMVLEGARLPEALNIAVPKPVRMAELLAAAGKDWGYGRPKAGTRAAVVLDTTLLQGMIRLPPFAGRPEAMVAEWRGMQA